MDHIGIDDQDNPLDDDERAADAAWDDERDTIASIIADMRP